MRGTRDRAERFGAADKSNSVGGDAWLSVGYELRTPGSFKSGNALGASERIDGSLARRFRSVMRPAAFSFCRRFFAAFPDSVEMQNCPHELR